jgi:hypothetical protein
MIPSKASPIGVLTYLRHSNITTIRSIARLVWINPNLAEPVVHDVAAGFVILTNSVLDIQSSPLIPFLECLNLMRAETRVVIRVQASEIAEIV